MCCAEKSVFDVVISIIVVFFGMSKQNKKGIYTLEGNLGLNLWMLLGDPSLWPGPPSMPIPHMLYEMSTFYTIND
jgi:hypothetical protein